LRTIVRRSYTVGAIMKRLFFVLFAHVVVDGKAGIDRA
jgi:hypothetical protein